MGSQVLIDSDQCRRTVARIAHEIAEHHPDPSTVALVGLHTRGVPLAERLRGHIEQFSGVAPAIGTVDIALYRDDVGV
ncbi:MAG: bifunctional pyr operon transcriptional regulator/uracil phosphoribosyltransferase, partial [Miltoncostaeaceae bacterium]